MHTSAACCIPPAQTWATLALEANALSWLQVLAQSEDKISIFGS